MVELHLELTDGLSPFLHSTSDLRQEANRGGLCLGEDIDMVRSHALLGDENLFRTVDDKVPSRIVWALIQIV